MKRALSVLLTVLMLLSLMTVYNVSFVSASGTLAADYPQLFNSANAGHANTFVVNPSWDLSSAAAGTTQLSFVFKGEEVTETYNASRHFSSYDDALAAWEARYTSGGALTNAIATAVPNFILAAGTYAGDITVHYSANIYGAYAGITPNDPSYDAATALPTASWGVNPARSGSAGETVISGRILRTNKNAGSASDLKYETPLKNANVNAYTLNIDGVKLTAETAVLTNDLAYNVGKARTNTINVKNTIFSGNKYGMSAEGDSSRDFNMYNLTDIRVTGMVSGSFIRRYPNTVNVDRMNFEGNAAYFYLGGTQGNANDLWWTSTGGARGVSFTVNGSRFADGTANAVGYFTDNCYLPYLRITFTSNVFKNAHTNTWGAFRVDSFSGSGYPTPQITMTGNTFYGVASKNYHSLFNGNQDYQKAAYNITFNENRVIGYGSPFPNLTTAMDGYIGGCVWNYDNNYFAESFTSASDEAGVAPAFYANSSNAAPIDPATVPYYYDYNKTTSSESLFITGASFEDDVEFFNISQSTATISAMIAEGTTIASPAFHTNSALVTTAIWADSEHTVPVTSLSYTDVASGPVTYYVTVNYKTLSKEYTFVLSPKGNAKSFADEWSDPSGVIANTAAYLTPTAYAAGSEVDVLWKGELYSFVMGTNAFASVADARAAGKTQVLLSGTYGAISVNGSVELYGEGYAENPSTTPAEATDDRALAWSFTPARVDNVNVTAAATPSTAAGTAIVFKGFEVKGRFNDNNRTATDYPTSVTFENMIFSYSGAAPTAAHYFFNNTNSNTSKTSGSNKDSFTVRNSRFTFESVSGYFRLFAEKQAATVTVDGCYFNDYPTLGWVKWTNSVSTGRYNVTNNYFKNFHRATGTPGQSVSFSGMADQCDSTGKDVRGVFSGNVMVDCFNTSKNSDSYFALQLYPGAYRSLEIRDNTFIDPGNNLGYIAKTYSSTYSNNTSDFADVIAFTGNRVLGLMPSLIVNANTASLSEKDGNYYARYTDDFTSASGDCRMYGALYGGDCYVDFGKTALNSEMAMVIERPLSMVNAAKREASFVIGETENYVPHILTQNGTGFVFYEDEDCGNSVPSFSAANVGDGRTFYAKATTASGAYVVYKVYVTVGDLNATAPASIDGISDPYLYYIKTAEMPYGTVFTHTWKGAAYKFTAGVTAFPSVAQAVTAHEKSGKSGTPNVILPAGVYQDKMVVTKTVNIYGENANTVLTSAPDTTSAVKIACVGDSITEGHGIAESIRPTSAYPAQLQTKLDSEYGAGKFEVKNFGWGGSTINVQTNRDTVSYTYWTYIYQVQYYESLDYNPDVVIIMMGHNDTHGNFYTTAEKYKAQYQALIDSYTALPSHPTVVIAGCTSRTASMRRDLLTTAIIPVQKELAEENGLLYIDMFTPTDGKENDKTLFSDGLHGTVAGYEMMAGLIKNGLAPILEASRTVNTSSVTVDASQAVEPQKKIKVACIGDSLTYGDKSYKGYPVWLDEILGDAYEVRNFGCCGTIATDNSTFTTGTDWSYKTYRSSSDGSKEKYRYSKEWQPDIVIFMLGYNDAGGHLTSYHEGINWTGGLTSTAAVEFKKDYKALIQEYIDLGAEVYLSSTPCTNNSSDKNGTSNQAKYINPIINEIATELGVPFVNVFDRTKNWSADMYCGTNDAGVADNTHMSDKGYEAFAHVMFEEVFGTFADNYVDDLGEIDNTAMVLDIGGSHSTGDNVSYNWEGKNWRFTWGVNAFASINDILNRATALGQTEVQALLVENNVTTSNSAGDFNLLYTDPNITSIEVFGINRRFDPNDKSAASTDPAADWTLNPNWDSFSVSGKTSGLSRIILNCNANNNNVILAGTLKFKGVTMRNIIWNSERKVGTASDPRNLDLVFENCVVDFNAVTYSGGYLYNANGPRNASGNSSFACGDSITFKNFRIEKFLYKNGMNRIFATYSDPFVTLDGFYYDGDKNLNGSTKMPLAQFGWIQTAPADTSSRIIIKNSNFRNDNFTFNCAPINNNVVAAGRPTVYEITNNAFVNGTAGSGYIMAFAKYYTSYKVENNYFVQNNSNPIFGINGSHTATDVNYVSTIGYSVKNNTFVLANANGYANIALNSKTVPDMTGSYVAAYTDGYASAIAGTAPTVGTNDYYYLDYARTVRSTDLVIVSMGAQDGADETSITDGLVVIKTTGGRTITDTSVTAAGSRVVSEIFADENCTVPASEFVLTAGQAFVNYYVKLSYGSSYRVWRVRFDLADAPFFATDFVDPDGVITKNAVALIPTVSGNAAGDVVTVTWQGDPYRFTVGANAFATVAAISSAKGTGDLQIIFPAGTYTGTFNIYGSWKIYGEGYKVNPNLIDGETATLNPDWSAHGVSLINNANVVVAASATPTSDAGTDVLIAGVRMNRYINDAQRTLSQYKTTFTIENCVYERCNIGAGAREFNLQNANNKSQDATLDNKDEFTIRNFHYINTNPSSSNALFEELVSPVFTIDGLCMGNNATTIGYPKVTKAAGNNAVFTLKNSFFKGVSPATSRFIFAVSFSGMDDKVTSAERDNYTVKLNVQDNTFIDCGNEQSGGDNAREVMEIFPKAFSEMNITGNTVVSSTDGDYRFVNWATISYIVNSGDFTDRITFKNNRLVGVLAAVKVNGDTDVDLSENYFASYSADYANGKSGDVPADTDADYYLDYALTTKVSDLMPTGGLSGLTLLPEVRTAYGYAGRENVTFALTGPATYSYYANTAMTTAKNSVRVTENRAYEVFVRAEKDGISTSFRMYLIGVADPEAAPVAVDPATVEGIAAPAVWYPAAYGLPEGVVVRAAYNGQLYGFTTGRRVIGSEAELANYDGEVILPDNITSLSATLTAGAMLHSAVGAEVTLNERTMKVACVGDSITEGAQSSNSATKSYPAQLATKLDAAAFEVRNFGKSAATVQVLGGTERAYTVFAATQYNNSIAYAPDTVIFALGTNDLYAARWKSNSAFVKEYIDLIRTYQALDSKPAIYVTTALARADNTVMNQRLVDNLLALQRYVAAVTGATVIDTYTEMLPYLDGTTTYFADNLHPNDTGYGILAQFIADELTSHTAPYGVLELDGMTVNLGSTAAISAFADVTFNNCAFVQSGTRMSSVTLAKVYGSSVFYSDAGKTRQITAAQIASYEDVDLTVYAPSATLRFITPAGSVIAPMTVDGKDVLDYSEITVNVGVADAVDLESYIVNDYANVYALYSDEELTLPVDINNVPVISGVTYYLSVNSPDGVSDNAVVAVTLVQDSVLTVDIGRADAPVASGEKVQISWRGFVRSHGEYVIELDDTTGEGFSDGSRRVGILYMSTNKTADVEAAKAAVVAAAQGESFDADAAAFNAGSSKVRIYAMASTRQLYWNDESSAWTYRYNFNVTEGKLRAAVAFVIYEDANGDAQVAFSDLDMQTASVN